MKKYKRLLIPIILLILCGAIATFVSFAKFNVANPFAVANGLFQVTFTDKQYVEIQAYPKVILAKAGVSLDSYMENNGFIENIEEQLGALHIYENENADTKEYVFLSVNKYFAQWHWNE